MDGVEAGWGGRVQGDWGGRIAAKSNRNVDVDQIESGRAGSSTSLDGDFGAQVYNHEVHGPLKRK